MTFLEFIEQVIFIVKNLSLSFWVFYLNKLLLLTFFNYLNIIGIK